MLSKDGQYLVFALEIYKRLKGMKGAEVIRLLAPCGGLDFILTGAYQYHMEFEGNMIDDVDAFLREKGIDPPRTIKDPREPYRRLSKELKALMAQEKETENRIQEVH